MTHSHTLIVGGSGFLGGHLSRRLLQMGRTVTHLRLSTRPATGEITALTAEAPTTKAIAAALTGQQFDTVFLLAAAGVNPRERSPANLLEGNLTYPAAVLEALRSAPPRAIVHTGSCSEYDAVPPGTLLAENHPIGGVESYGASKAIGGLWLRALAREFHLPLVSLRLFQMYGAGEAPHRLLSHLLERLSERSPVALSPGHQVRDFLYVEDAIDGLLAAAQAPAAQASAPSSEGVYNLCSAQPLSVADFARAVADALHAPQDLLHFGEIPQRPDELPWVVGSGERFFAATQWRPRWPLAAALSHLTSQGVAA